MPQQRLGKRQRAPVKGNTGAHSIQEDPKKNASGDKAVVENVETMVQAVEPMDILMAEKRGREDTASQQQQGYVKRTRTTTKANEQVVNNGEPSSMQIDPVNPKKKRTPPRRLPVHLPRRDICRRLQEVDAGLSVAEWLAIDKAAFRDIRDGLCYLHGRKPKGHNQGAGV